MSVLDTVKKGYLHIKTATDEYMRILPRTLASLILMNDGSTAEDSINGKLNKTSVVNNLTSTITGNALDATQGKALKDEIGSTDISAIGDGTVTGAIAELNGNISKLPNNILKSSAVATYYSAEFLKVTVNVDPIYNGATPIASARYANGTPWWSAVSASPVSDGKFEIWISGNFVSGHVMHIEYLIIKY